jgi:PAS domain S-box-containing protein
MLDSSPLIQSEPLWHRVVCPPLVVSPETIAIEAIRYWSGSTHRSQLSLLPLQARGIDAAATLTSCIAIVEDGQILGLLTEQDLVRLTAERCDLENVAIREVMIANLVTLRISAFTELSVAVNLLEQHRIRYLPVVDDRNCLIGIVTSEGLRRHLVEDLTAKIDRQSAQLQEREVQIQAVVDRANDSILDITARRQAERALQESQHFIEQIAQASPNILYVYDLQAQRNVYVNREISIVLGYTPAEIQAMGSSLFQNLIHPEDLLSIPAQFARIAAAQDGDILEFEYRMKRANGEWCWLLGRNSIFSRDLQGGVLQTIGTAQDITDRKQSEQIIYKQAEQAILLKEITQRIRKSLNLQIVFETAVREIRVFLETDRVGIFQFRSDFELAMGEFVAESVGNGFGTILGSKIQDPNFGEKLAQYYQQGRVSVVEDIHAAGLLDEEVQTLAKFQVRANLVVPLFDGSNLWGLLCVHHCAAQRCWQESEITFLRHMGEQIGIAIQQASLYHKVQSELEIRWRAEDAIALQLRQQQALGAIAQQIRNSLRVEEILATATDRVKELMMVDRVTIFQILPNSGDILTEERKIRAVDEVVAPEYPSLMGRNWENECISQEEFEFYLQGNPRIVVDMTQDRGSPRLREYLQKIGVKSKIVAPILLPSGTTETFHQPSNTPQIQLWGLLSIHMCSSPRDWQAAEAQLLQQIADQLAIAIQQASLFEQLQAELVERQQAEIQLRQSNQELARATRLKDEFLANMSHELRTPLNAILGMSEALQESAFGSINDRQQKSISSIEKSGRHLLSLINDILDLSKIEANKFDLEFSDVSIQSLCQNSLLFIKELAHKRQIQLTTQLPEDLKQLKIRVDDRRCRQVLINLLSNAVKFTPEGGSVTLDVRVVVEEIVGGVGGVKQVAHSELIDRSDLTSPLRRIAFSIIDTGIGISPENIAKLFQSFVQIDSSLNRQYAGTGLGLALVKRIVELHGGTVSVESTVDRGSCFTMFLPFEPSTEIFISSSLPPRANPLPTVDRSTTNLEKALVLVVEDNQANMETMTGYLKIRGYRSIEAGNGQQAIDFALRHRPDIILMDIQMPGMDGFEASRQIRQIPECAAIPIVALTALAMPDDRQKCLDAGANQYVSKPVKLGQLISTIESLLHGD